MNNAVAGDYWVVAIDKRMSGWGQAKGGKSAIIIHCHDDNQAYECEKALSYDNEMKYVKTCYGRKPVVNNAAHIQELDFLKCPRWNKDYMFTQNNQADNDVVSIDENTLRGIVAECVKKVLNEREFNYSSSLSNDGEKYIKCPECGNECLLHDDGSYECQVCGHSGYPGEESQIYDFYVAADTNSDYFNTFEEAYDYAKSLAMKETNWYEPIDIMDNREWKTIVRFDSDGEHDFR